MARPRTARFRASAPKGARTGCPRLIFEAGCLVRSAPGPGTADARGYSRHPGCHSLWLLSLGQARESSPGCGAGASRIQTKRRPQGGSTETKVQSKVNSVDSAFPLPFDAGEQVLGLAAKVRLVLFDVDGVLTDGRLVLGDDGQEYKAFNSKDGHGIKMLQRHGVATGIITGRSSRVVEHRVLDLGIQHVYQGRQEKLPAYEELLAKLGLAHEQAAFLGDDVVDLPIMLQVGLAAAVQNAHPLAKQHAHWVTPSIGGYGAARELCELILFAQGAYGAEMQKYLR